MGGVIYMYTSPSGKSYIGQTWYEKKRKREHQKNNIPGAFASAVKKYGFDNMKYEILHLGIETQEQMNYFERLEITIRNTLAPNGYNLDTGGGYGRIWTESSKQALSKLLKGRPGKKLTERAKQKIREARIKQVIDPQIYINNGLKMRGCKRPPDTVAKMKLYHQNRPVSHIENLMKSRRNRKYVRCVETGTIYESCWDAAKSIKPECKNGSLIIMNARGNCLSAYGYHWEYVDERA